MSVNAGSRRCTKRKKLSTLIKLHITETAAQADCKFCGLAESINQSKPQCKGAYDLPPSLPCATTTVEDSLTSSYMSRVLGMKTRRLTSSGRVVLVRVQLLRVLVWTRMVASRTGHSSYPVAN
ncbi:hypothetical protein J6590_027142 [Homalodisca vitripennis]|nr:hypothetical protein J6590_027142 [Homalodisca vitripennis]